MDPSKKGWFRNVVQHHLSNDKSNRLKEYRHPDEPVYHLVQPTGLMYGIPVLSKDSNVQLSPANISKIQLVDGLVNIYSISRGPANGHDIEQCIQSIYTFYKGLFPDLTLSVRNWLGREKNIERLCESLVDRRISKLIKKGKGNIWASFFNNTQLFVDVYLFRLYCIAAGDDILLEYLRSLREEISLTTLKVIAAAAHANNSVVKEERELFEFFIANNFLQEEKKRIAREYLEHGIGIQKITIEDSDSWVLKKFLLELSILTIWSDKELDDLEIGFIGDFARMLGLSDMDRELSMLAVEGFFLDFWSTLHEIANRLDGEVIAESFLRRLNDMLSAYESEIVHRIRESRSLVEHLRQASVSEPDENTRAMISSELLEVIGTLPVLRVIKLPAEFLGYKRIIKVLPKKMVQQVIR